MPECNTALLLLCYTRLSPLALEITFLFLSIIGGLIIYFGLEIIPFYIDSKVYKTVFLINIPFFIIIFILNVVFIIFRYKDLINNELHLFGYILSIFEVYMTLFGIITNLINDTLIIGNMKYYNEISLKKNCSKYPMIKPIEWLYTKIAFPSILLIWFNMLLMALTDNLLIDIKIKASYHDYELAIRDDQKQIHKNREDNHNNNSKEINTNIKEDNNNNSPVINTNNELKNKHMNTNNINKNTEITNINNKNTDIKIDVYNFVQNNYNININIDKNNNRNNYKRNLISSINAFLSENNNLNENLKQYEEKKY